MLVPIIFIVALILTLGTAMLENGLAATKIALQDSVARYSDVAVSDGVADFTAELASFVKQHGSRGPWPGVTSTSFPRSLCDASVAPAQCPFSYTVGAAITGAASDATAWGDHNAATNVQTSVIGEQRLSAVVTTKITTQNGTLLASRTRLLTYRVFEAEPYAIVSGSRDTTSSIGSRVTAQGDSGGTAPEPELSPGDGATLRDTRIHVQLTCSTAIKNVVPLVNDQQATGNDGLPWGNTAGAAYETPCHQPASSADAFADRQWSNGNTDASGWTR